MNILEWPEELRPSSMSWRLLSAGTKFESVFNGAVQTVRFPGSKWKVSMSFDNADDYEARAIESILFQLDGMAGRIRLPDFGRWGVPPTGTPVVFGAGQLGASIVTAGWLPNRMVIARGQYLSVNDEMKFVTADVWSNGSGAATIPITPVWRKSPADGASVEVENPKCIFMLLNNENGPDRKPAFNNDFTLDFVEYI